MGKKKSKTTNASLGKALINNAKKNNMTLTEFKGSAPAIFKYTDEDCLKPSLKSVMEPNSLDDYVHLIQLAN